MSIAFLEGVFEASEFNCALGSVAELPVGEKLSLFLLVLEIDCFVSLV